MQNQSILALVRWRRRLSQAAVRFAQDTTGTALVEFGMVLPLFFLLLFGSIGWGYSLTIYDSMFDAARQAARELAVGSSDEATAAASAESLLENWPNTFSITAQDATTTGTNDVRVVVSTPNAFATIFPFVSLPDDMSAVVVMRRE